MFHLFLGHLPLPQIDLQRDQHAHCQGARADDVQRLPCHHHGLAPKAMALLNG